MHKPHPANENREEMSYTGERSLFLQLQIAVYTPIKYETI